VALLKLMVDKLKAQLLRRFVHSSAVQRELDDRK